MGSEWAACGPHGLALEREWPLECVARAQVRGSAGLAGGPVSRAGARRTGAGVVVSLMVCRVHCVKSRRRPVFH